IARCVCLKFSPRTELFLSSGNSNKISSQIEMSSFSSTEFETLEDEFKEMTDEHKLFRGISAYETACCFAAFTNSVEMVKFYIQRDGKFCSSISFLYCAVRSSGGDEVFELVKP